MPLRKMGDRGRQWMIAEYSWPAIAQQMMDVYSSLALPRAAETIAVSAISNESFRVDFPLRFQDDK
jgi:hypothetical protein